jgi:hypothetical protein
VAPELIAGQDRAVDDITFLFQRNPKRTPEDFVEHYLDTHAVMGRTWVKGVNRYAVSLNDQDQSALAAHRAGPATIAVDALTELSVEELEAFFDTDRAFDSPEQVKTMMADHDSMFGEGQHAYRVQRQVVVGGDQDWPTTDRTPGVKLLTLLEDDGGRPQPGEPGVWRSAVSTVLGTLSPGAPPLQAIAERQFRTDEDLQSFLAQAGTLPAGSYLLSEYLQLP